MRASRGIRTTPATSEPSTAAEPSTPLASLPPKRLKPSETKGCHCGPRALETRALLEVLFSGSPESNAGLAAPPKVSLSTLTRLTPADFRRTGMSAVTARRVTAALELGRRAAFQPRILRSIECSSDVEEWALPRLSSLLHEEVWVLSLDARNGLIRTDRVGQGGVHGCGLQASDILRPPVRCGASAFVLVHNHPSGDPSPSQADLEMTVQIARAAELIGVPLLDHVVIARGGTRSVFPPTQS
jgi:DNA repair protein RadC